MKKVNFKRRREKKTDYKLRLGLLKSGKKRIVVRKTNRYLIVQAVASENAKDRILVGLTSKELLKFGWTGNGSLKSIPAGYLTGLLTAKKLREKKIDDEFILDIGMAIHKKGGRIYAVAKGLVDGGVKINVAEEVFPSQERINGEHLKIDKSVINKIMEKLK